MNSRILIAQSTPLASGAGDEARVVKVVRPQTGQAITIHLDGTTKLDLSAIANTNITLVHVGDRLVVLFDNQATVTLDPFYDQFGEPLPQLMIGLGPDREVSSSVFAALFPITTDLSVLPAAGAANASGAHFNDTPAVDALTTGTPLSLLDSSPPGDSAGVTSVPPRITSTADHLPQAAADTAGVVEAGVHPGNTPFAGSATVAGNVLANDADPDPTDTITVVGVAAGATGAAAGNVGATIAGIFGTLVLAADGRWIYALDNADPDTGALAQGAHAADVFTYTMRDAQGFASTATLTIDVTGTNDAPVITSTAEVASLTEQAGHTGWTPADTVAGILSFADVDRPDAHSVQVALDTVHWSGGENIPAATQADLVGALTAAVTVESTGAAPPGTIGWTFSLSDRNLDFLAERETLALTYVVTVSDGDGATSTQTVTVTITGSDDAPVITLTSNGSVTEDIDVTRSHGGRHEEGDHSGEGIGNLTSTGTLGFADVDLTDTHAVASVAFKSTTLASGIELGALAASVTSDMSHATGTGGVVTWSYSVANDAVQFLAANETVVETYTVTLSDGHGGTVAQDVRITVIGTNDGPVIAASDSATVTEQANVTAAEKPDTATGTLHFTDVDLADAYGTNSATLVGVSATGVTTGLADAADLLGFFTPGVVTKVAGVAGGTIDWTFSAADRTFDYLAAGEQVRLTYTVQITDPNGTVATQTVSVIVTGTNDAPVIATSDTATFAEQANVTAAKGFDTATGTLHFTDVDLADVYGANSATLVGVATAGVTTGLPDTTDLLGFFTPGNVTKVAGTADGTIDWTFSAADRTFDYLAAGEQVTLTYTVQVADPNGATATQTVSLIVTGTNDAPVIAASDSATVTEQANVTAAEKPDTATGTLHFTDVDFADVYGTNSATLVGVNATGVTTGLADADDLLGFFAPGAVTKVAGVAGGTIDWTFSAADRTFDYLAAGEQVTLTYTVQVADPNGAVATQTVSLIVTGTNDTPVIAASDTADLAEQANLTAATAPGTATGTLHFTDVDLSDTYGTNSATLLSVSAAGVTTGLPNATDLLGFLTPGTVTKAAGAADGTIDWTFSAADRTFDYLAAGEQVTLTYTVQVADPNGATATQTVSLIVTGTNDAPTLSASLASTTYHDTANDDTFNAVTGTLTTTDRDSSDSATYGITGGSAVNANFGGVHYDLAAAGTYGTLYLNSTTGAYIYAPDDAAIEARKTNTSESFTLTVTDGSNASAGQTLTVNIDGANDEPTLSASLSSTTYHDTANDDTFNAVTGTLTRTDRDSGDSATYGITGGSAVHANFGGVHYDLANAGTYGTLYLNSTTGAYTYVPNDEAIEARKTDTSESFTLTVTDGSDATASKTFTVDIDGANDAASITGTATGTVTEDGALTTGHTLTVTDADSGDAHFRTPPSLVGTYGTFTFDASTGAWGYTLNNSAPNVQALSGTQTAHDTLTVASADGTASQTIDVGIIGSNDAAVLSSATADLTEADSAAAISTGGTLTISDIDSPAMFVAQTNVAGSYGHFSIDTNGAWSYTADTAHNEFRAGQTYTDTFTVAAADGTTTAVTINIAGTNDAAVLSSTTVDLTEADTAAAISTSGVLSISDVDSPTTFAAQTNVAGSYGHFSIDADGTWSYTATSAHDEFRAGQTYVDTFTVSAADGTTTAVTIAIAGTSDAAILSSATANLTETDTAAAISTGGTLTISDIDSPAMFVAQTNVAGSYGHFSIDTNGAWSYTADTAHNEFRAGQTYTDTFTVAAADGTTTAVTINILGTNDAAILSSATANLTETDTAAAISTSGTLTISDVDSSATFVAQTNVAGAYGHFSIDANGAWSYTADTAHDEFHAGQAYTDTFTVSSADGTTTAVTINIIGTNDAAVLSSATADLTEIYSTDVIGTGGRLTISDIDSPAMFAAQTNVAGTYGHFSINTNGAWNYIAYTPHNEFRADQTYADTFMVSAADGTTTAVTINITGTNDAPELTGTLSATTAEGSTHALTAADLGFTDLDNTAAEVVFTVSGLTHGTVTVGGIAASAFTGAQLANGLVAFTHDGSEGPDASFQVSVEDGDQDASAPETSTFNLTVMPTDDGVASLGISGDATQGQILSANLGADPDGPASDIVYHWLRDGVAIPGANASTYTLAAEDIGHRIAINVTYADGQNFAENVTSAQTAVVARLNHDPVAHADSIVSVLNADTDLDLFIAGSMGTYAKVALNDGTGTFSTQSQSYASTNGAEVALADVDGDGDLDALVSNSTSGVLIQRNNGDGTFVSYAPIAGTIGWGIAVGDLNGDGAIDAVVSGSASGGGTNKVLLNNGSGSFTVSTFGASINANSDVALGDLDGDGDLDAFVVNGFSNGGPSVWLNNGSGTFTASGALSLSGYAVALGDFNRDGKLDAYVGDDYIPQRILYGNGDGTFQAPLLLGPSQTRDVALGDVNGDGWLDLVTGTAAGVTIRLNNGSGGMSAPLTYAINGVNLGGGAVSSVTVNGVSLGDIDGDGDLDIVAAVSNGATAGGYTRVLINDNAADTFTLTAPQLGPQFGGAVAIGNLDNVVPILATTAATLKVLANDTDADGDTLTISAVGTSAIGAAVSIAADGLSLIYNASASAAAIAKGAGQSITDTFTYTVSDGHGGTSTATVTVKVTGVNDAPVITSGASGGVAENQGVGAIVYQTVATDPDSGTTLTYSLDGADKAKFLIDSTGAVRFVTSPNYEAPTDADSNNRYDITVIASDGTATTSKAVTIEVTEANDAPKLNNNQPPTLTISEGGTVVLTAASGFAATDEDTTNLTFQTYYTSHGRFEVYAGGAWTTATTFSTLDIANGAVRFVHDGGENAPAFVILATDGIASSIGVWANVVFTNVNDAPTVSATAPAHLIEATASSAGTATASATLTLGDVDGTPSYDTAALSAAGWTNAGGGLWTKAGDYGTATLATETSTLSYALDNALADILTPSHHPTETFVVPVIDNAGATASASVTFTVDGANDAPVPAGSLAAGVAEGGTHVIAVAELSEADPDDAGAGLTYAVTSAAHGNLLVNGIAASSFTAQDVIDGKVVFQHDGSEGASAGFGFTLADGGENGAVPASGAFTFTVSPVDDGVATLTIAGTAKQGEALTASLGADPDGAPSSVVYHWLRDGAAISGATGATYTLGAADVGHRISAYATYADGQGFADTTAATAETATVIAANSAPVITSGAQAGSVTEDVASTGPDLIANGTFEEPYTLTSWVPGGNNDIVVLGSGHDHSFGQANFNTQATGATATLTQTISTVAGTVYTLDFWLKNWAGASNTYSVSWNGVVLGTYTNVSSALDWVEHTYQVVGTGGNVQLTFSGLNNVAGGSWLLDDITLRAAPTEKATGQITFTDADPSDIHAVTVTPAASGYLGSFVPVLTEANGNGVVNWTYSVPDTDLQVLAAGQTLTQTYTVTISDGHGGATAQNVAVTLVGVNDAPVLDAAAGVILGTQARGNTAPSGAVGTLVSALIGGGSGPDNVTDADGGAKSGIAVIGTSGMSGTWYYSTNNGSTWTSFAASSGNARLLAADASTRIYFKPTSGSASGTAVVTFEAWDQTTGVNGGTADAGSTGGTTAFSDAAAMAPLYVSTVTSAADLGSGSDTRFFVSGTNTVTTTNANLSVNDLLIGGSGTDTLNLNVASGSGTYNFNFSNMSFVGFERVALSANPSRNVSLTFGDYNVLSGQTLTVDGSAITTASRNFTVDASAVIHGDVVIIAGASTNNVFRGGAGDDTFRFTNSKFTSSDTIVGGSGTDTIHISDAATVIDGDFTRVSGVEALRLGDFTNSVTLGASATTAIGSGTLTIDATAATAASPLTVNGSGIGATAHLDIRGGAGNDALTGGAGGDRLTGNGGTDMLTGGLGADRFVFGQDALADAQLPTPKIDQVLDYSAAQYDSLDLSALLDAAFAGGQQVSNLVRVQENANGTSASVQVDVDGTTNGANFVTIAQLTGAHSNDVINVILDHAQVTAQLHAA
jgi:VCBS repeat-containing protein